MSDKLKEYDVINKLKKITLFNGLEEKDFELISQIVHIDEFKEGEFVIHEGELGDKLYIILKGKVRVLKKTFSDELYTVVDIDDSQNAFFGEFSLLDNEKRSASILTITPCVFLTMTKDDFEKLISMDYRIGYIVVRNIAKRLSERLRAANNDIITLFEALENEIEGE